MKRHLLISLLLFIATFGIVAQPHISKVQLIMVPDNSEALYPIGQKPRIDLTVLDCGMAVKEGNVKIEVSNDLMPPHKVETIALKGNKTTFSIGTMTQPGFLRVKASIDRDGKTYSAIATVGFDTHKLTPVSSMPDDFSTFWTNQLDIVRKVDLKPVMTIMPERCTDKVNTYHISYGNINNSRMYGILTMPRAEGKYPAILRFPGAGVGEKGGDIAHASRGVIVLELGIHGIPVDGEPNIYRELNAGALASYPVYNIDNRYTYYYRRVFLGCVRGVDFLLSLPQCNGRIGTLGGSQGGALSIVTSSLDDRIMATATYFPAMCDHEGYIHGRAGGWPHLFKNKDNRINSKIETARYYDTANFARLLKSPVYYLFGYNDLTCAPTTTCATFNAIPAPKELIIGQNIGHWLYPEQTAAMWDWIITQLQMP